MTELHDYLALLDSDPRVRGRQFERTCKWLLENSPEYTPFIRKVWLWEDWPGRWGIDAGIDLVAETNERTLWAIQAKAYDPSYSVTKRDVDAFLTESATPMFEFRLLVATTDRLGTTARGAIGRQEKLVGTRLLSDLASMEIDWPESPSSLLPATPIRKTPWRHNEEAVVAVCEGLETHDRGQLVMACGTGKTLVGLWAAERQGARRTLVVVPSLSLLSQTLREWSANCAEEMHFLPVCSDDTVSSEDHFTQRVSDLGLPVTTDPRDIKKFLERPRRSTVICTYQSLDKVAEAQLLGAPEFDLAIADEAHRCVGAVSSAFARILDSRSIRSSRRLFMTATPRYIQGKRGGAASKATQLDRLWEFVSMDDEETFGPVLFELSFNSAIDRDLLADYRVVVVGVDDDLAAEQVDRRALFTIPDLGTYDAATVASELGLLRAIARYDLRRVITFHNRVARAHAFAASLGKIAPLLAPDTAPSGRLVADYVAGTMSSGMRSARLRMLASASEESDQRVVLSNARCLSEGVDVPNLDGVAFIEPRQSQVDIVQAVGRVIRKAPDKTLGTVVLPVVLPSGSDDLALLDSSAFSAVWQTLRALRAHDETLGEWLDEMRRELGRGRAGSVRIPPKLVIDLPAPISAAFLDAFYARLVRETTSTWDEYFGAAQRFYEREGHLSVPADHVESRLPLGAWVQRQRNAIQAGRLAPDRVKRLEQIEGWSHDPYADRWDASFQTLVRFAAREGHSQVPVTHVEDGIRLGKWVTWQRFSYKNQRLPSDQVERLQQLPGWCWNVKEAQWEAAFARLMAFFERSRSVQVPFDHVEDGFRLGYWVSTQHQKRRRGTLPIRHELRLARLPGWVWRVQTKRSPKPRDDSAAWERAYEVLVLFASEHSHARVPQTFVSGDVPLGKWVAEQRRRHRRGTLPDSRTARLEAVAGWSWDPVEDLWHESFAHLRTFAQRYGHPSPKRTYMDGDFDLGEWVASQRKRYLHGMLSAARVEALEALDGWTWKVSRRVPRGTQAPESDLLPENRIGDVAD